ncbi:MAG: bile acid:sodium symporter family protein [Elusimicrobia bacterium]|nr:bile acid:sodium symporter family protein [Candidatus Liberimonas magnetica]
MFNSFFDRISRSMVVLVIFAGLAGYFYPPCLSWLKPYLEWLFALTMLGIGMVTNPIDYKPMITSPKPVLLGVSAQFGIMPLASFLVAKLLQLPPELALGLIIAGSVPDAMALSVVSYAARADVPYSIALTSVITLLAPILTPTFTYIFGHVYLDIPFLPMVISILKMVIIPLAIGLTIKHYYKSHIEKFKAIFPAISSIFIACICGLVVALNRDYILNISWIILAAVFLLNTTGLILGYWAGILFGFDIQRRRTVALCVGMQNAGLGAVLAIKHFGAQAAVPNAIFATWCIISASILAWYWNRQDRIQGTISQKIQIHVKIGVNEHIQIKKTNQIKRI